MNGWSLPLAAALAAAGCARGVADQTPATGPGTGDPILDRHSNEQPVVFISRPDDRLPESAGKPAFVDAAFDLAVFADGTYALEGTACVARVGLQTGRVPEHQMTALRALVDDICFALPRTDTDCGPERHTEILCKRRTRETHIHDPCGRVSNEFVERVVHLVGLETQLPGAMACGPYPTGLEGSLIQRTIFPPEH